MIEDGAAIVEGGCVFYPPYELGEIVASLQQAMRRLLTRTRRERSVSEREGPP